MVIKECLTKGDILLEFATRVFPTPPPPKMSALPTSPPASPNIGGSSSSSLSAATSPMAAAVASSGGGAGGGSSGRSDVARSPAFALDSLPTPQPAPRPPVSSSHTSPISPLAGPSFTTPSSAQKSPPAIGSGGGGGGSGGGGSDNTSSSLSHVVGGMPPRRALTLPAPQPSLSYTGSDHGYATNAAIPPLQEASPNSGDAAGASEGVVAVADEDALIANVFGCYNINIVKTSSSPLGMVLQETRRVSS